MDRRSDHAHGWTIEGKFGVGGEKDHGFAQALGHQQAIEGVLVVIMLGQVGQSENMIVIQSQPVKTVRRHTLYEAG